ncbi:MAG: DNA-binding protein WhiA, partial [Candidatus Eremiobacteraeota bacterium]|nr:DNA-binding protein WhiA [Candidatus Eremiobacteraeota bacterium]
MISGDTKDALARDVPEAAHCRQALRDGLALYGRAPGAAEFVTHRNAIARLFWSLLDDDRKTHPIQSRPATRLARLPTFAIALPPRLAATPPKPIHKCDRLVEIRAAFLACGSVAAGTHGYHLEFVLAGAELANRLEWMLRSAGVAPKSAVRKGRTVLYYKDFETIVELLTLFGAFGAVLHLEDVRALRETKNRIHRLVNTEAANLERTAAAAAAQRHTIEYLENAHGLHGLSPALREIAELRMAYPDESLAELGRRCSPPIAKP